MYQYQVAENVLGVVLNYLTFFLIRTSKKGIFIQNSDMKKKRVERDFLSVLCKGHIFFMVVLEHGGGAAKKWWSAISNA